MQRQRQKKRSPDVLHCQTHPLACETCQAGAPVPSGRCCCDSLASVEVLNTNEKELNKSKFLLFLVVC